ncbi:MAG: hypothetical protein AB8B73_02790 [Ekhidna sp.]
MPQARTFSAFLFVLLSLIILSANAQNYMKVNSDLKAATEPQLITRKGIKVIPYYSFGDFKVTESKAGASNTTTVGGGNMQVATQNQKLRFTLVNSAIDYTVKVNMEKQGRFAESQVFFESLTFSDGGVNVVSEIAGNKGSDWTLVTSWSTGSNISSGIVAGDKEYQVVTVTELEGKSSKFFAAMSLWMGFEVFDGDKAIAAVQTMPVKGGKPTFASWIHPDLSPEDQTKMASSLTALLVITNNQLLTE